MTVNQLITALQAMPQNMQVLTMQFGESPGEYEYETPEIKQEWDDETENYVVVL